VKLGDQARLGARVAGALGRIAADRIEEALGDALPRTAEQLARPDVVDALLRDHPQTVPAFRAAARSPLPAAALPPVRAVALPGIEFESSNCTNFLIEVDWKDERKDEFEGASAGAAPLTATAAEPLPKTLYAKIPCPEVATRAFAHAVGFWRVETHFCQHVASRVPIRVPRVFAAAQRGARFVLLLENLGETPGTKLFINRDMAAGTTPERARMCLSMFAELHAAFWGLGPDEREAILPERLHTYLAPGGREMTRALNASGIAPSHAKAPEIFRSEHVALCERAIAKWDALIDAWYGGPLTLIHGDSHLANCFEYATPEGPRMGMIDFQGLQWCHGIRDVQYFLINSLEPDVLAAHESELIDHYIFELARHGVGLAPDTARAQYRALSFQTLMVAVVSFGLGSLTERDETVRTILRRSVAAIDRLGFADWLDGLS